MPLTSPRRLNTADSAIVSKPGARIPTVTVLAFLLVALQLIFSSTAATANANSHCPSSLDHTVRSLTDGKPVNLCEAYRGKVVLIVNTASKCGFTPQYDGLEALYKKYKDQGLVVLGFPSNDFGGQEPGDAKQIKAFCRLTYGVKFPMFEKTHAAKANADPLYRTLGNLAGEFPAWNFHKYLLDRNGKLVASYKSKIEPLGGAIETTVLKLL